MLALSPQPAQNRTTGVEAGSRLSCSFPFRSTPSSICDAALRRSRFNHGLRPSGLACCVQGRSMDTKVCTRCHATKTTSEFTRHKKSSDGLNQRCRTCTREIDRQRLLNPDRLKQCRERNVQYRKTDKGVAASHRATTKYVSTNRDTIAAKARNHYRANPDKVAAKIAVQVAIRRGLLSKAQDEVCSVGVDCLGKHNWHHDSYLPEDRLKVRCLCLRHHQLWHKHNQPKVNKC